jgi:hypothetical protein
MSSFASRDRRSLTALGISPGADDSLGLGARLLQSADGILPRDDFDCERVFRSRSRFQIASSQRPICSNAQSLDELR